MTLGCTIVPVHALAERLLAHIQREEFLHAGDRVGVAVSGGVDSVALLRLLLELRAELGIVVSVVHFNHQLRGVESGADQQFVAHLARERELEFYCDSDDVAAHAAEEKTSLEQAARDLRYGFFSTLLGPDGNPSQLTKLATGHTLDDQAETVLMRLIRGTGLRGLRGIHPRIPVEAGGEQVAGEIIRPLLATRHRELQQYLTEIGQPWREDSTNSDAYFTRNRLRRTVLPLLESEFNSSIAENLSDLSELARGEEDYWENEAAGWFGTAVQWCEPESSQTQADLIQIAPFAPKPLQPKPKRTPAYVSVSRPWLVTEPIAVGRRVIKAVAAELGIPLEFKHIEEILRLAAGAGGKEWSLPGGWKVVREAESLLFLPPDQVTQKPIAQDYEYALPIPGRVKVPGLGATFEALVLPPQSDMSAYNPQNLLNRELLPAPLILRNWRAGDRFWPAHTKAPKKIKELLQERHIAQPERKLWPVVVHRRDAGGDEVVWLRGFPVPARYRTEPGHEAMLLREISWAEDRDEDSEH
jgi:tRNA(Ile)-lysidine synthase